MIATLRRPSRIGAARSDYQGAVTLDTQPSTTCTSGVALATQPVAKIPRTKSGVVITASIVGGGPSLTNPTATTDATGVATFSGLALTAVAAAYRLRFTADDGNYSAVSASADTTVSNASSAPTVSAIVPPDGNTAGGDAVTITGTGFSGSTVTIGGASATSVVVVSATSITCVTPAGTAGAKNVVVTNSDTQTGTLTNGFTYLSVTPWFERTFDGYANNAAFLADNAVFVTSEDTDFATNGALDATDAYPGYTKSWKINIATGTCAENTNGRNLRIPSNVTEGWFEFVVKWTTNWDTIDIGGGCSSNPDHKLIFLRNPVTSRWAILWGNGGAGDGIYFTRPDLGSSGGTFVNNLARTFWDNAWHIIRIYARQGVSDGAGKLWIDGTLVKSYSNINLTSYGQISGIGFGRNLNQGPSQTQAFWLGRLRGYNTDPGW